jgi:hypothetical protein
VVNVTDVLWGDETLVAGKIGVESLVLSSSFECRTAKKWGRHTFRKTRKYGDPTE